MFDPSDHDPLNFDPLAALDPARNPNPLILEVVPPPAQLGDSGVTQRVKRIREIAGAVPFDAINIPEIHEEKSKSVKGKRKSDFEPRVEPRVLGREIQEQLGIPVIINRVVVHHEQDALLRWFEQTLSEYRIHGFVLVGGERGPAHYPGPTVTAANSLARQTFGDQIRVGNISIPARRVGGPEAARMQAKVESGSQFFTTQIVYQAREFNALLDDLNECPPQVASTPIMLSMCPVRNAHSVSFLHWLGVNIDADTEQRLLANVDQMLSCSIEHLLQMWEQIQAHIETLQLRTPVGLNIAPVGPIPSSATVELAQGLRSMS